MKIDPASAPSRHGTGYPPPYDEPCRGRRRWKLGDAAGLTQFGVNLLRLAPGDWSSQRHAHATEDEFVFVVSGDVVLIENAGETPLTAGDCAGFKAGSGDGHHIVNRSTAEAVLLEIGGRNPAGDAVDYPDIDLILRAGETAYRHRDGRPYDGTVSSSRAGDPPQP